MPFSARIFLAAGEAMPADLVEVGPAVGAGLGAAKGTP